MTGRSGTPKESHSMCTAFGQQLLSVHQISWHYAEADVMQSADVASPKTKNTAAEEHIHAA